MKLTDAVVLVTGANRGIGAAFARHAVARGARKVYAGARDPSTISGAGLTPLALDVIDAASIRAAATACPDVTLVINNAGIALFGGFFSDHALDDFEKELDVNLHGPLRMSLAFAPILASHGGGAIINVLSIASWINRPMLATYGVSKTAAWGLTNALRHELRGQKTQVLALHMGFVDTDLTKGIEMEKSTPDEIVVQAYDGLEAGADEVLADARTRAMHAGLSASPSSYLIAPVA